MSNKHCPGCNKPITPEKGKTPWRPFCSERCKMIDLGDWFSEKNRVVDNPEADFNLETEPVDQRILH